MDGLSLALLGPFQASLNNTPIEKFRSNRVQALLIYLATETAAGQNAFPRDALLDLLWPGLPQRSAQTNLRTTIYRLKKAIPVRSPDDDGEEIPFLLTDRKHLRLNPDYPLELDISSFLRGVGRGNDQAAEVVSLYRGDFLQDFYLADAETFEDWAAGRRAAYKREALNALSALADSRLSEQDFDQAKSYARRQLELDNLRERAHRQLMGSLAQSGQRTAALAQFETCRALLSQELGVEPSPRTQALYEQILSGAVGTAFIQTQHVRGYELREEIGVGAFGTVYRAFQPVVEREVAVKIIVPQYANQPEFIRRFEAEARLVARLEHPYIVPLYDFWREPDGAYLVMRWLRGGNLSQALRHGPFTLERALSILDQVAAALATAHRQGIIHRDIKPANILLDEVGNAYLSDFGIAKDLVGERHLTRTGAVIGSPAYISPEQILGESATSLTDLYSMGLVLYQMLTGRHPWCDESLAGLLYKHAHESLPSIREQCPDTPAAVDEMVQRATAKNPADRYPDALALAAAFRLAASGSDVLQVVPATGHLNPYKGLRTFQESDAADFFGREALVEHLLEKVSENRFTAVVGPSGSGKSSVVKAGLIPALRLGAVPGADNWFIVEMKPGSHPLEELEAALLRVAVNPPPSLLEQLAKDERGLLRAAKRVLPGDDGCQLLLVVDQFEELFTLVEDRDEVQLFIDSLGAAATDSRSQVRVILTLRADFYDRPLVLPNLSELVRQHTEVVVPMTSDELSRAAREPALRAGATFQEGLVTALITDVLERPGALPLLQYTLTELFERRQNGELSLAAYRDIGGVMGALSRRAEELYAGLDPAAQAAARQLFLRLVTLGEGTEDTRRRALRADLEALVAASDANEITAGENGRSKSPPAGPTSTMSDVIDAFGRVRLLTFDRDPLSRAPTVEVAHEALLREWPRLREWLDESRDDLRQHYKLSLAAAEWEQAGRGPGFLLRGSRLDQIERWSADTDLALTETERHFLAASLAEREVRRREETERQAREAALERRSQRFLRALVGVFAVAAVVAVILTVYAFDQRNEAQDESQARATAQADAETQKVIAEEQKAAAQAEARAALEAYSQSLAAHVQNALGEKDSATALVLALEANRLDDPPALSQRMLRQAAYAPGPARQFQVAELFPDVDGFVYSLAMSPNDNVALIGFESGTLILWDVETGDEIRRLAGHTGTVRSVAFSPDGRTALSGASDRLLILWDLETGREIRRFEGHEGWVRSVAFSPDGQTAVSGGFAGDSVSSSAEPGQLILWDLQSGREIRRFDGQPSGVVAAAFTPDGQTIVASSGFWANVQLEYGLSLWDVETGEKVRDFEISGNGDNYGLTISPDGSAALTGTSGQELILWDTSTGQQTSTLQGHIGHLITAVAYTPDGRLAFSGDSNGMLILWDLASGRPLMQGQVHTPNFNWHANDEPVLTLALSSDGLTALSSGGQDGTLMLWSLRDAGEIRRLSGHQTPSLLSAAFTPDGNHALTGEWGDAFGYFFGESNSLRLWDLQTGQELWSFEGHTAGITDIAVSADGRLALSGSWDGTIRLWDLETGEEIRHILAHNGGVMSIALSADGSQALSGSISSELPDSGFALWDLKSGELIHYFYHGDNVASVAFAPDGQTAFAGGSFYDLASGQVTRRIPADCCTGEDFHPDGRSVFLGGTMVHQWDLETDRLVRSFGPYPGTRTRVEVSPDGRLLLIIGLNLEGGVLSLWDLETGQEIRRFTGDGICCYDFDMSPVDSVALTPAAGGTAILWNLNLPIDLEDVLDWIAQNRYVRELTCEERELYKIEPLCEQQ